MFACRYGMDVAVMKLLERNDIQANLRNEDFGSTALILACAEGKEDIVKLLLEREEIDTQLKDKNGRTAYDRCSSGISGDVKARLR
jgi:ankyrin repeat protein